jgi:hypothetical protein
VRYQVDAAWHTSPFVGSGHGTATFFVPNPSALSVRPRAWTHPVADGTCLLAVQEAFEADLEDFYGPEAVLPLPTRPAWHYGQSKTQVEGNEAAAFRAWLAGLYQRYPVERLSLFEHNLEVWRQLWRVGEMSDIVLLVADIRFPLVHFPPALAAWVQHAMKRQLVLVLNKIDLVSSDVVHAWERYFRSKFPGLHVATFSCYPAEAFAFNDLGEDARLKKRTDIHRRRYHRAVGVRDVLSACRDVPLVKNNVPVDWAALIERYSKEAAAAATAASLGADPGTDSDADEDEDEENDEHGGEDGRGRRRTAPATTAATDDDTDDDTQPFQQAAPHPDLITIGLVGTRARDMLLLLVAGGGQTKHVSVLVCVYMNAGAFACVYVWGVQ